MAEGSSPMSLLKVQTIIPRQSDDCENTDIPIERSGHRIIVTANHIFVIGGFNPTYSELFNEVWSFNISTNVWTKLKTTGPAPTQVASHSMCLLGNSIIVFGGSGLPFGMNSSNDIYQLDLLKQEWQLIPCQPLNGDAANFPSKRYGHTMHPIDNYIYICGGTEGTIYMLDLYRLELSTKSWEYIECKNPPEPRYRHETVVESKKLYIFGGGTNFSVFDLIKIPVLDFDTFCWSYITSSRDIKNGLPLDRKCHGCVHYKHYVYICGGTKNKIIFKDVWRFSLKSHRWTYVGEMPKNLYFHGSAVSPNGCMYLFGGVTENEQRVNTLFRMQLDVPSLQEMCWRYICHYSSHLYLKKASELREIGIPSHLIKRMTNCLL
ncbi:domain-containing 10-like [Octopus vulgaris]|uniref:Kelch domain-containing protein 10 n=1 Tax=Octopus vulgaris TaxID=6645 RepID=A0AA36AWH7_OCTVU|nr:domain-containing 10-like [Octopus vulgaris]